MKEREMNTAKEFGILDRVQELENELKKIDHVVDVDFDLDGFWSNIHQVILVPKYDIPVSLPDYYDVRHNMLKDILKTASSFGLHSSGDSIEDYGEHFYIVRNCDDSWKPELQNVKQMQKSLAEQIEEASAIAKSKTISPDLKMKEQDPVL